LLPKQGPSDADILRAENRLLTALTEKTMINGTKKQILEILCTRRGISHQGTKADLVLRLFEWVCVCFIRGQLA
jgi:hypothetical protein